MATEGLRTIGKRWVIANYLKRVGYIPSSYLLLSMVAGIHRFFVQTYFDVRTMGVAWNLACPSFWLTNPFLHLPRKIVLRTVQLQVLSVCPLVSAYPPPLI